MSTRLPVGKSVGLFFFKLMTDVSRFTLQPTVGGATPGQVVLSYIRK